MHRLLGKHARAVPLCQAEVLACAYCLLYYLEILFSISDPNLVILLDYVLLSVLMCQCHFCVGLEKFAFVTGCWLFHPSWHMCIYKRMFESENKTLTKEGILHFLELYETKHLPNSFGFSEVRQLLLLARTNGCSNL